MTRINDERVTSVGGTEYAQNVRVEVTPHMLTHALTKSLATSAVLPLELWLYRHGNDITAYQVGEYRTRLYTAMPRKTVNTLTLNGVLPRIRLRWTG